jgi:hypothetical protein
MCPCLGEFCSPSFLCFCLFDPVHFFVSRSRFCRRRLVFSLYSHISSLLRFLLAARKFFDLSVLAVSRFPVQRFAFADPLRDFLQRFLFGFLRSGHRSWSPSQTLAGSGPLPHQRFTDTLNFCLKFSSPSPVFSSPPACAELGSCLAAVIFPLVSPMLCLLFAAVRFFIPPESVRSSLSPLRRSGVLFCRFLVMAMDSSAGRRSLLVVFTASGSAATRVIFGLGFCRSVASFLLAAACGFLRR